ncbi:MAG: hypothetical protein HPY73_01255 [Methanomassiliicoccales archaeon]|nr:MAG: hypothetical protein HPY73_01255 [Methanomassiliicoccales archaeon]
MSAGIEVNANCTTFNYASCSFIVSENKSSEQGAIIFNEIRANLEMETLEEKEIGEVGIVGMIHQIIPMENEKRKSVFQMQSRSLGNFKLLSFPF